MDKTTLLETKNLTLIKNSKKVLDNISIEIKQRDFISLIGPNGAGKTMLIKCLTRLQKISSGKINFKNKIKIGYVPQKLVVEATVPITVLDFIKLKEKINPSFNTRLTELVEQFKLNLILNKQLNEISGGQLQKTFLLKALLREPDLLVLDEPEKNLDVQSRVNFYQLLQTIYEKNNLAILLSSHELNFVMKSTKKVICLFSHICCSGKPEIVAKDPQFMELFGEKIAQTVLLYTHENHNHSHHHF